MGNYNRDNRGGGHFYGRRDSGPRNFDRGGGRGDRTMYQTTCSNCGQECEVPFRPTNGKPVYCSSCFEKMSDRRSDSPRPERSSFRSPSPVQNNTQFDAINAKLDKILTLLQPKVPETSAPAPAVAVKEVVQEKKEDKTKKPKAKKASSTKKK